MQSIPRRSFIGALAAANFIGPGVTSSSAADEGFKLGVATYSLRKFNRTQAISMIKQLNVRYVNIKEYHLLIRSTPEQIAEGRKEFEDAGVIILGGGNIPFDKDDDADIRHKFEYAKMAGMPL